MAEKNTLIKVQESGILDSQLKVIEECISTEYIYVNKLIIATEVCLDDKATRHLRGKNHLMFSNYRDICTFHRRVFFKELISAKENVADFANCFIKRKQDLRELYSTYCNKKPTADALLISILRQSKYSIHCQMMQSILQQHITEHLGNNHDVTIDTFLALPVQRCTKYFLLLKSLLEVTDPAQEKDIACLKEAITSIDDILHTVNSATPAIGYLNERHPCVPFGTDLNKLASKTKMEVPYIVRALTKNIEERFINIQNLYNSSDESIEVINLRKQFEIFYLSHHKHIPDMSNIKNHLVLTTVLKEYIDELPESLVPDLLYDCLIERVFGDINHVDNTNITVTALTNLFSSTPCHGVYTRTLNVILRHFEKITDNCATNHTTVQDLALQWCLLLIKSKNNYFGIDKQTHYRVKTRILEIMILHRKKILWRSNDEEEMLNDNCKSGLVNSDDCIGDKGKQRYFCVPFVHADISQNFYEQSGEPRKGYLFYHFMGANLFRMVKLPPGEKPLLIFAKEGDIAHRNMLQKSNLKSIENAAISRDFFNITWQKYGGEKVCPIQK